VYKFRRKNILNTQKVVMNGKTVSVEEYIKLLTTIKKLKKICIIHVILELLYISLILIDHNAYAICNEDNDCGPPSKMKPYSDTNFIIRILALTVHIPIVYLTWKKYEYRKVRIKVLNEKYSQSKPCKILYYVA
jgi:hypothetical protein